MLIGPRHLHDGVCVDTAFVGEGELPHVGLVGVGLEAQRVLKPEGRLAILDINRFWLTPFLVFFMKFPIKPLGLILFGRDKWEFFIHSLENSLREEELKRELESNRFKVIKTQKRLFGIVYIVSAQRI